MTTSVRQDIVTDPGQTSQHPAFRPAPLAVFETALIVVGLAGLFLVLPHHIIGDAPVRYDSLLALLRRGELSATPYSMVGPLFALPLLLSGELLHRPQQWVGAFNSLFFAGSLLAAYLLLRPHLPGPLLRRFLLALIAASMFPAHVVGFNSEVFTAMAVAVGLIAVAVRRAGAAGWTAVVLGVANTPGAAVGLALVVARRCLESRRLRYGLVLVVTAALILGESWLRRGSPLTNGYENNAGFPTVMPYSGLPEFSYPPFLGLLSLCLSFGKGLFFFAPGLLLPVRARMRAMPLGDGNTLFGLYSWWLLFVVGLVGVYASWWAWYGGVAWGPRFLLLASVPAALALAVRLWDLQSPLWSRLLTLGAWLLSCWVGLCGAVFPGAAFLEQCLRDNYALESLCHYTPEFSVLWYPLVADMEIMGTGYAAAGYVLVVCCYLAGPLVRSILADVATAVRAAVVRYGRGWGW